MNTISPQEVMFKIYIHNKPRYARHARLSSISSMSYARLARLSSKLSMTITWPTCSLAKQFEQYTCYDETTYPRYWFITCQLVTLGSSPKTFVSKVWKMPPIKSNNRTSSQRKQFLISNFGVLSFSMRPCKSCSFANKQCLLGDASEKCLACVASGKPCDLAIPFDVVSKQFQFPELDWSPLATGPLAVGLNESCEVPADSS